MVLNCGCSHGCYFAALRKIVKNYGKMQLLQYKIVENVDAISKMLLLTLTPPRVKVLFFQSVMHHATTNSRISIISTLNTKIIHGFELSLKLPDQPFSLHLLRLYSLVSNMKRLVFTKTLKTSDIQHRLHFPTYHLDILPFAQGQREVDFQVRYGENPRLITFRCIKRRGRHPKPTITRGWSQMVRRMGLREGDELTFYVEDGQPALYQIEVQGFRQTMLFGSMVEAWVQIL